jgi:hypothetical protein
MISISGSHFLPVLTLIEGFDGSRFSIQEGKKKKKRKEKVGGERDRGESRQKDLFLTSSLEILWILCGWMD